MQYQFWKGKHYEKLFEPIEQDVVPKQFDLLGIHQKHVNQSFTDLRHV